MAEKERATEDRRHTERISAAKRALQLVRLGAAACAFCGGAATMVVGASEQITTACAVCGRNERLNVELRRLKDARRAARIR